ncbi:hypothetical protein OG21DRAFT_655968 [Imleria badia]|nr:hypothetical protein OG21DRAFT_655968 [Imleria badia]
MMCARELGWKWYCDFLWEDFLNFLSALLLPHLNTGFALPGSCPSIPHHSIMLCRMKVEKVEERWSTTTIQTAFVFHSTSKTVPLALLPKSGAISIDLPLPHLGWTFTLSLTPEHPHKIRSRFRHKIERTYAGNWIPAAFSFRQHGRAVRWGNTSICAQLSLGKECIPHNNMGSNSTLLGTMNVVLEHTPAFELPLTTPCTISSLPPNKVWLSVTISDCPLADGLFEVRSGLDNEAKIQAQLVRQSGDRVLSRSLGTGQLFDVKFLAFSTRSTSGNAGVPLPTYASLTVLEEHVNLSSSIVKEGWTNALAALDNTSARHVREILCPDDYEYELDSDFEDEEEASLPCDSGCGRNLVAPEGQQSESGTERSSSLSSFEMEGASDLGSVDYHPEEVMKAPKEQSSDCERTVWVKFAAHRTWHAFLWYCYTGDLKFGKLKSQVEPGGRHLRATPLEGGPPTCSPKSMYRLADLVGDEDLKDKALAAIKENMTEENVLDETFSVFTSKYPDIRDVQLGVLMEHCDSPKVKEAFLRAMEKYSSMPHAKPVLSAFYDNLVA